MIKNNNTIVIDEKDNVAVAVKNIKKGEKVFGTMASEPINFAHKISLKNIKKDEQIIKYGYSIGYATKDIVAGQHVHVHNMKTNLSDVLKYEYKPNLIKHKTKEGTFKGYKRDDGSVGVRNEIWIINTVGCVNKISSNVASICNEKYKTDVDGVFSFEHPYGCSQLGEDHEYTKKILANMVKHPNATGVLVLGLGCENNTVEEFKKELGEYDNNRVKFVVAQKCEDEVQKCISEIDSLVEYAKKFKREDISLSKLVVGLKCGGSDGFSGITANPLVGKFSDELISYGGTALLTEVPEMFGAETILMNRCKDKEVFNKTVNLINDFKNYFKFYNQEIYENPSPGNKDGGITTLEDKSLGCTQKCGTSNVVDVLNYGEIVKEKGLNLLQSPGNDIVATTALMASGAHIILFTTGRGTPLGSPMPTVKISSNENLAKLKSNWIDFDASHLLYNVDKTCNDFFEYIIKVANGEKVKNEINNYREIAIFKNGVTL